MLYEFVLGGHGTLVLLNPEAYTEHHGQRAATPPSSEGVASSAALFPFSLSLSSVVFPAASFAACTAGSHCKPRFVVHAFQHRCSLKYPRQTEHSVLHYNRLPQKFGPIDHRPA